MSAHDIHLVLRAVVVLHLHRGRMDHTITTLINRVHVAVHLVLHGLHFVVQVVLGTLHHTVVHRLSVHISLRLLLTAALILQRRQYCVRIIVQLLHKVFSIHPCNAVTCLLIGHLDVVLRRRGSLLPRLLLSVLRPAIYGGVTIRPGSDGFRRLLLSSGIVHGVVPRAVSIVARLVCLTLLITGVARLGNIKASEVRKTTYIVHCRLLFLSAELVVHQNALCHHVSHVSVVRVVKLFF